jgi:hypothetical protein
MSEADGGVRRLVLVHGRERARTMVAPEQRPLVDIAAEVLGDDAGRIGISYSGFCLTGLPHKRLPDDQAWEKRGHRVTLLVEPGRMRRGQGPARDGRRALRRPGAHDPAVPADAGGPHRLAGGRTRPQPARLVGTDGPGLGRRDRQGAAGTGGPHRGAPSSSSGRARTRTAGRPAASCARGCASTATVATTARATCGRTASSSTRPSTTPCGSTPFRCARRRCASWPTGARASTSTSGSPIACTP